MKTIHAFTTGLAAPVISSFDPELADNCSTKPICADMWFDRNEMLCKGSG